MKITLYSEINNHMKLIVRGEALARKKAAKYLQKKIRDKINKHARSNPGGPPGRLSGDLKKGIGYKDVGHVTLIGAGPPAHYAHLLEFGTEDRHTKDGKNAGRVLPRPFLFPTFDEESMAVQEILSQPWLI